MHVRSAECSCGAAQSFRESTSLHRGARWYGRHPGNHFSPRLKYEPPTPRLDLKDTKLNGIRFVRDFSLVDFVGSDLIAADLSGATFSGTNFNRANLNKAQLLYSDLSMASFNNARLTGADLTGANLHEAYLLGTDFSSADLKGAEFSGAHLSGADLRSAQNLTQGQIDAAFGDPSTKLPEGLHSPESWNK